MACFFQTEALPIYILRLRDDCILIGSSHSVMRLAFRIAAVLSFLGLSTSLLALQQIQFQRFGQDYGNSDAEANQKAEFGWSRLRYDGNRGGGGYGGFGGFRGGYWGQDYPKGGPAIPDRAAAADAD